MNTPTSELTHLTGLNLNSALSLDYSEATLSRRIRRLTYENVQGIKNMTLELPKQGIVRINAPSEVGKSAMLNIFEAVVLPKYRDTESIQSLVNTYSKDSTANFMIETYNDDKILLHLSTNSLNDCFYLIQKSTDAMPIRYPYYEVPKVVTEILGWLVSLVDKDTPFCLNLQLNASLFMIDTPTKVLSDVLNISLNDALLDKTIIEVRKSKQDCAYEINEYNKKYYALTQKLNEPIEDVNYLQSQLSFYKNLKDKRDLLNNLLANLTNLFQNLSNLSDINPVSPELDIYVQQFSKLTEELTLVSALITNLEIEQLGLVNYDFEMLELSTEKYNLLSNLANNLIELETSLVNINKLSSLGVDFTNPPDFNSLSMYSEEYFKYIQVLKNLNYIKLNLENEKILDLKYQQSGLLHLNSILNNVLHNFNTELLLSEEMKNLKEDFEKYSCPTCGQLILE